MIPTKEQFQAALVRIEKLVPAPRVLSRAMRLLQDPCADLDEIATLLAQDSALTVEVLRCANSAFYANAERISAVGQAVQVIGFRETVRLLNLVTAHQTANRDLGCYGISAEDFWAESLFNGLFLEALATRTHCCDPAEAYTAGLLRFIGRLAINQTLLNAGGGLFWDSHSPLADWETENVGMTQAEVGAILLQKWDFPAEIVHAIAGQDASGDPSLSGPLGLALHFTAQVFPAGLGQTVVDGPGQSPPAGATEHPLAREYRIGTEQIAEVRTSACDQLLRIRQGLYA